jgi:glycosyltransferase involved in cell wall biosynthesis
VLVRPGDPRALADALDAVLCDPDRARALGNRAEKRAAAEYDLTRMVGRYAAAYARQVAAS